MSEAAAIRKPSSSSDGQRLGLWISALASLKRCPASSGSARVTRDSSRTTGTPISNNARCRTENTYDQYQRRMFQVAADPSTRIGVMSKMKSVRSGHSLVAPHQAMHDAA